MAGGFAKIAGLFGLETVKDILLHPVIAKMWEGRMEKEKTIQEYRFEMMAFLEIMDDQDAGQAIIEMINDRQFGRPRRYGSREPYRPGDEHRLVSVLTLAYKHLGDKDEEDERLEFFKKLGNLARTNPEAFDAAILAMDNDVVLQYARRFLGAALPTLQAADRTVATPLRGVNTWLDANWVAAGPARINTAVTITVLALALAGAAIWIFAAL